MFYDETNRRYCPESNEEFARYVINITHWNSKLSLGELVITEFTNPGLKVWLAKRIVDEYERSQVYAVKPDKVLDELMAIHNRDLK